MKKYNEEFKFNDPAFEEGLEITARIREDESIGLMLISLETQYDGKKYVWPLDLHVLEWTKKKMSFINKMGIDVLSGRAKTNNYFTV